MKVAATTVAFMLASASASAQINRVDIAIDETVSVYVGNAIGWFCDDPSLLVASMTPRDGYNEWTVTGVKQGVTQCRIGIELGRASVFVEVHVLPRST